MKIYDSEINDGLKEVILSGSKVSLSNLFILESTPQKYSHINFKPTEAMAKEAQKSLDWRSEYGRGGTDVGIARARQLVNRQNLSPDVVKRMFSFFSRHEVNKKAKGFRPGEEGYPSNGRIAWCLTGDTEILLSDGTTKTIEDIVENKLDVEVVSYDEKTGTLVNKKVIDWLKFDSSIEEFNRFGRDKTHRFGVSNRTYIDCTKDHPILTRNGWIKSEEINLEEDHAIVHPWFDQIAEQVLIGSLLGDSSLGYTESGATCASFHHSIKQKEYLLEKARILSVLGGRDFYQSEAKSGFGKGKEFIRWRTRHSLVMSELIIPLLYDAKTNKKIITEDALDCMGLVGLAFFVCDDGSFHDKGPHGIQYRLHTEGFDLESVEVFVKWLEKIGINSKIYKRENCDGYVIYITKKDNVYNFAKMISPYIPESMRYKLPKDLRQDKYILSEYEPKIEYDYAWFSTSKKFNCSEDKNIKRHQRKKYLTRYDLTIEDSHSFVANGIIVHNSLWGGDPGFSWSRKIVNQMEAADKKAKADESLAIDYYQDLMIPEAIQNSLPIDSMLVNSILVSTNWNKNDDVFSPDEVWKAKNSPIFKSVNVNHIGRENKGNQIIGVILGSKPVDENYDLIDTDGENIPDFFHIAISSLLWEKYWPSAISEIKSKIDMNEMFVSMECMFTDFGFALKENNNDEDIRYLPRNADTSFMTKYLRSYGGTGVIEFEGKEYRIGRWLKNIEFTGVGFVDKPANPQSIVFQDYISHVKLDYNEENSVSNLKEEFYIW